VVRAWGLTLTTGQGIGIGTASDPTIALKVNGIVSATSFQGSGAALTGLPASALTGTINDARLSANVPRLNATQTFTAANTFLGPVGIGGAAGSGALTLNGDARLNDSDVFLRAGDDGNHGLGWYGASKLFGGMNVDGPVLYGCSGGGLGTMCSTPTLALAWNNAGNVIVDPHGINAGSFTPGLTFGMSSQEAIASRRAAGGNQYGLDFYTWGTNRMSLTQSGRMGIGTTAPVKVLDVVDGTGASRAGGNLHIGGASANADEKLIHFGDLQPTGLGYVYLGERGQDDTLELCAGRFYFSAGNVGIGTSSPTNALQVVGNISATGTITPNSDRNLKTGFASVDVAGVLEKVAALPIQEWRFQREDSGVKHVGPMAQDFQAAFGLGANPTAIATVDADGVALAAIQGLNRKVDEQQAELTRKQAEIADLRHRLERLEHLLINTDGSAGR